jgi:hypothetical protein
MPPCRCAGKRPAATTGQMRGAVQMRVTAIGLDIAENVFQVRGIDANEKVVVRKQLRNHF